MLLKEFFGPAIKVGKQDLNNDQKSEQDDQLFWYIINHDKIHKDYFMPLGKKIKRSHKDKTLDKLKMVKEFMPMVNKGCQEYYRKNKLQGRIEKLFPKELREKMCQKLFDHYYEDVIKDSYKLGEE